MFGIEPNVHVMHTVVRAYRAAMRQGTPDTKTRGGEVRGVAKPWRREGAPAVLVRVRSGSPMGRAAAPFSVRIPAAEFRVNRKEVKLAMRSALSAKLADGQLMVEKRLRLSRSPPPSRLPLRWKGPWVATAAPPSWWPTTMSTPTCLSATSSASTSFLFPLPNTMELMDNKVLVLTAAAPGTP